MNQALQHFSRRVLLLKAGAFKKAAALFLVFFAIPILLFATHFRYGSISWVNTSGNTVTYTISQAWRWSFFGNPTIGAVVNTSTFDLGDGTFEPINITITSVNPGDDWFFGTATITHTYASVGNYTANWFSCCRISTLVNNPNGQYLVQTTVNVGGGNSSPVSNLVPIIDMPANVVAATFLIPAVDPNGGTLSFRLSTSAEAGNPFTQPSGLSINNTTGLLTFNTVGKNAGELYSAQVMIGDGTVERALDFIIRIANVVGAPPFFNYPPTPANGQLFTVNAGQALNFSIEAADNDAGNTVTLSAAGVPVGAGFTPSLPTTGNPVSSAFSWTTSVADIGTYVVNFNAQDNTAQSANTSVTIQVIQACNLSLSSSITNVSCKDDNDGAIELTISGANGAPTISWSNGETTEDISGLAAGTYSVTVTDVNGCEETASYNITEPDELTSGASVSSDYSGYGGSCAGSSDGSVVVTANGGTAPYQYTVNATTNGSGIFTGLAAATYNYTVTDAHNCTSTGSFIITAPPALGCSIAVSPNVTVANHATHTIYLGYGPQSVTLTGSGSGGVGSYSYNWGSLGSGSTKTVSPVVTTTYQLTITDANGCSSVCQVTIYVVDVRCGNNLDKVLVCHKQTTTPAGTICITQNDVATHLAHGDYLGNCAAASTTAQRSGAMTTARIAIEESRVATVLSNPGKNDFTISLKNYGENQKINLRVTDALGRLIDKREISGSTTQVRLGANYNKGLYFVTIAQGKEIKTLKVFKQ